MKLTKLMLTIVFSPTILTWTSFLPSPVSAQCLQADVGVQYNISGSSKPTIRNNDIEMENNGSCQGNSNVTIGVQGNIGGRGQVIQNRKVRNRITGTENRNNNPKPVQIKTGVEIDVYNPADNWR